MRPITKTSPAYKLLEMIINEKLINQINNEKGKKIQST